jgi:hypothetical protein
MAHTYGPTPSLKIGHIAVAQVVFEKYSSFFAQFVFFTIQKKGKP